MPAAWPFTLRAQEMDLAPVGGAVTGGGAAGPNPTGATLGGPHWRLTLQGLNFITRANLLEARAFQGRLDCGATPVIIPVCDGDLRPVTPGGTVTAALADHAAAGTDTLEIDLAGDFLRLRGGEHLSLDHENAGRCLYRVTEILGGTDAAPQVRITPFLRQSELAGAVIDFMDPSCTLRLVSGFQLPVEYGRWSAGVSAVFEEWFPSSTLTETLPDPEPPDPETAPSSPDWRIFFPDGGDGGGAADCPTLDWVRIVGIEMRATAGGPDLCVGGTASASEGAAANAFDGDTETRVEIPTGTGSWIGYEFLEPVTINQVAITMHNLHLNVARIEYRDEADDWITWWQEGRFWTDYQETKVLTKPAEATIDAAVRWRLLFPSGAPGTSVALVEVEMRAGPSGPDQCTGGVAASSKTSNNLSPTFPPSKAFDDILTNASRFAQSAGYDVNSWLEYTFPEPVTVGEVTLRIRTDVLDRSPGDVTVEYHNGTLWTTSWAETGLTWSLGENKVLTKP